MSARQRIGRILKRVPIQIDLLKDPPKITQEKLRKMAEQLEHMRIPPETEQPYIAGAKLQAFTLTIQNNGGTLEHKYTRTLLNTGLYAPLVDCILGPTNVFVATPTGADGSTAMANGGKIGSVNTNEFIIDHQGPVEDAHSVGTVTLVDNTTATALIMPGLISRQLDVNGVDIRRWHIRFMTGTGNFALTTANIAAGKQIAVAVRLYLPEP